MSKSTKELKDAVEARIDVEQRRQIVQILAREGMLDEQTTEKLQRLMREVEGREVRGRTDGTEHVAANDEHELEASPTPSQPVLNGDTASIGYAISNGHAVSFEPAASSGKTEEKPFPFPPTLQPNKPIEAPPSAKEISSREKFAELERKNLEMSQALEQLTKERELQDNTRIPQRDDLHADELAYRIHHVTSRFNNEETSWIRVYWPLIAVVVLAGLAVWVFFTFSPLWSTL
jgi:hypothetical protein